MQVKITRGTVANGEPVKAGRVITVDDLDGNMLIGLKKAVAFKEPPKKAKRKSRVHNV